ncbi:MAG: hypothetical protein ACO1OB_28100 [Archangium sp.]
MNRVALVGVVVLVACEPSEPPSNGLPPVTLATRREALEFARQNPFQFATSEDITPPSFSDLSNFTWLVVNEREVHVFYKEGTDPTELLERVETEVRSTNVFAHATKFSQHEHRSVLDWVLRSPLRPWLQSGQFNWSLEPAQLSFDLSVEPTAIEAMRLMREAGGVPADSAVIRLSNRYEPQTGSPPN